MDLKKIGSKFAQLVDPDEFVRKLPPGCFSKLGLGNDASAKQLVAAARKEFGLAEDAPAKQLVAAARKEFGLAEGASAREPAAKVLLLGEGASARELAAAVVISLELGRDSGKDLDADPKAAIELKMRMAELHARDRADARKREMAIKDKMPGRFAFLCLGGFLGLVLLIACKGINDDTENVIYAAVGILGTILSQIAAYYFGSSRGSHSKDGAIHDFLKRR